MADLSAFTFVVTSNNDDVLSKNLLRSTCLNEGNRHQLLVQRGFSSAANAFNDALANAAHDVVIFVHQDIIFPKTWTEDLVNALKTLETVDPNWGVLGCYGETLSSGGRGFIYEAERGFVGKPLTRPEAVQTLDEIVLIVRRSSGLRFNSRLRHFHFYGADICMAATHRNLRNYAIPAFCIHNAQLSLVLPREFYLCYKDFKRLWHDSLPVQTTCIRITKSDFFVRRRQLHDAYLRHVRRVKMKTTRLDDVEPLLRDLESGLIRFGSLSLGERSRFDVAS